MRYLLAITLIITTIALTSTIAQAQTVVLPSSTVVLGSHIPNEQWNTTLAYMYISAGHHYVTLVQFPAVGIVSNATVSINITAPPPIRPFFYRASSAYNPATVTYTTRPAIFNLVYTSELQQAGVVNFDVTSAVNAAYPEPLTIALTAGGFGYGTKSSIQMTYTLASQQPPTPMPTPTPEPTATPSPTATPHAYSEQIDLPSGNVARVEMTASAGESFIIILLMLLLALALFALLRHIAHATAWGE